MEELDFLDGREPEETAAPIEQPDGPLRGPDGKFAAKEPDIAPEPASEPVAAPPVVEPQPQQPPPGYVPLAVIKEPDIAPEPVSEPVAATPVVEPQPQQPPPGYVPLAVIKELREEIKALKAAPQPQQQQPQPDPYEDPQGWAQFQEAQTSQIALNVKLDLSESITRDKHGDETVESARDWALARMAQSPAFRDEVLSNRNPYEFVVQAFQRDQVISQLKPSDIETFRAWQAQQAAQAAQPVAAPVAVPTPPRSLASLPSAGSSKPGEQPVGPGVAFNSIF